MSSFSCCSRFLEPASSPNGIARQRPKAAQPEAPSAIRGLPGLRHIPDDEGRTAGGLPGAWFWQEIAPVSGWGESLLPMSVSLGERAERMAAGCRRQALQT